MFYEYNILLNIHEYIHTCSILEMYMSISEIHLHEIVNPEKKFEKENHIPDWRGIDSHVSDEIAPRSRLFSFRCSSLKGRMIE